MKRRIFVKLAAATAASLYLPNLSCKSENDIVARTLSQPHALEHICDAETIREIGNAYQKLVPNENSKATLMRLLAANIDVYPSDRSVDRELVSSVLDKRVRQDFQENRTMVVDGWILSVTEARQCALFSLTQN
ncbi:MAG TPA: hypothetical protein VFP87_14535 [Chitinophagaceae bacterium]|nr:hypothetical protein [Chitinophagaceae bacterium]